jgi:small conductance mechanosensitive channel
VIGLALTAGDLRAWLATHGVRVLVILISVAVARLLINRLIPPAVRRAVALGPNASPGEAEEVAKRAETLAHVAVWLTTAAVFIIGGFMLLSEVGYNLAPVITGIGIGGIAVGLGAQSLVKDTINGIFILGENQFRRGDFVTVSGVSGVVEDVNLRRTVLRDMDGTVHSVPNSEIKVSSNHTRDYSGLNFTVLVPQSGDLERALALIGEVGHQLAADHEYADDVIEPPRPERIEAVEEKGVTVRVLGKARPGRQGAVAFEYRRRLKEAFDEAGLGFAVAPPVPAAPAPPAGGRP